MGYDESYDAGGRRPGKILNANVEADSALARSILMIDAVASRYHCMPSEVISRGDTLDLFILNTALAIQNYHAEQERAKAKGKPTAPRNYKPEDLQAMLDRVNKGSKEQSGS